MPFLVVPMLRDPRPVSCAGGTIGNKDARRSAQLDLFQPIDDLVKVKDEVRAVGNEQSACAVQSCVKKKG